MQGLGGLAPGLNRGATMSGNKALGFTDPSPTKYDKLAVINISPPTLDTFTAAAAGLYQFAAIGAGGLVVSATSGGGGALGIITKRLRRGDVVAIQLGCAAGDSLAKNDTILMFPDGSVATAGGGKNGNNGSQGGVATGFDVNVQGSPGGAGVPVGGVSGAFGPFGGGSHPAAGHGSDNVGVSLTGYPMPGRVTINYAGS